MKKLNFLVLIGLLTLAWSAQAQLLGISIGGHRGVSVGIGVPLSYAPAPVVYAAPPVYYAQPSYGVAAPYYYPPTPVAYAAPPVYAPRYYAYGPTIVVGGGYRGWYGGGYRGHYGWHR
jgi:hypothetical protein